MNNKEAMSSKAALTASRILRSAGSSKAVKSMAGSALSKEVTSEIFTQTKTGAAASKALRQEHSSKSAKTSAGSALTQTPKK